MNQFHILNGDSLRMQFPKNISGNIIVMRECLVDGNVEGETLTEFMKTRAKFISNHFQGVTEEEYYNKTFPEFKKIQNLPHQAEVNLWFEDDLFCQVNFWFVAHLLFQQKKELDTFLVRPKKGCEYGFGWMNENELTTIFYKKIKIEKTELEQLALLWKNYQQNNGKTLLEIGKAMEKKYPFLTPAIHAHLDRFPTNKKHGRPTRAIIEIMNELQTNDLGIILKAFGEREAIYGFGDRQMKRLMEEIEGKN